MEWMYRFRLVPGILNILNALFQSLLRLKLTDADMRNTIIDFSDTIEIGM